MPFYVMEKFCDFFTLRPSDLFITLTYVLMDNFCPYFLYQKNLQKYIYIKHLILI